MHDTTDGSHWHEPEGLKNAGYGARVSPGQKPAQKTASSAPIRVIVSASGGGVSGCPV